MFDFTEANINPDEIEHQCNIVVLKCEPTKVAIVKMTPEEAEAYLMKVIERIENALDAQDGLRHCIAAKRAIIIRRKHGKIREKPKLMWAIQAVNRLKAKFWQDVINDYMEFELNNC